MRELLACCAAVAAVWLAMPDPGRLRRRKPRPATRREQAVSWPLALVLGAVVGVVALLLTEGWVWPARAVLFAVVAGGSAYGLTRLNPDRVRREAEERQRDLPATLRLLAAASSAGLPLRRALEAVTFSLSGVLRRDLDRVQAALRVGLSEAAAWQLLDDDPTWHGVASDIGRAAGSGSGLEGLLRQHALDAEENQRAALEEKARTVGVRSVLPLMVCFLPAFVLIGIVPIVGSLIAEFLAPG